MEFFTGMAAHLLQSVLVGGLALQPSLHDAWLLTEPQLLALAGCIFLANAAYVQATLTWCLLTPFLYKVRSQRLPHAFSCLAAQMVLCLLLLHLLQLEPAAV